jgi:hypothetical protein
VLLLAACGTLSLPAASDQSNLGGDGLPVQTEDQQILHDAHPVTGVLRLQPNGCWTVEADGTQMVVIFPIGFLKPPDDGRSMQSPDGFFFSDGSSFEGMGSAVPVGRLPGYPDGLFGDYLAFCGPDTPEVFVLDSIDRADTDQRS